MMNSSDDVILDFRTILGSLALAYGSGEFTTRDFHGVLMRALEELAAHRPDYASRAILRFRTKIISNDLRRLYSMGFLKRRRAKRECRTRGGKVCFRGYEYRYSISSQGRKYLNYLANPEREEARGLEEMLVRRIIERHAQEDQQDVWWEFYKAFMSRRRGFRRFSTSKGRFWDKLIEYRWRQARDEKISELEKRVKELEEENRRLRRTLRMHAVR